METVRDTVNAPPVQFRFTVTLFLRFFINKLLLRQILINCVGSC